MKKRLAAIAILILVIYTLTGCFPTGVPNSSATSSVLLVEDRIYKFSKDNLDVSFEIPEMPEKLPLRIKLKKKFCETNEIINLFLGGKTIVGEKTWSDNYYTDDQSHIYVSPTDNEIQFNDGKTAPEPRDTIDFPANYQMPIYHIKEYFREEYFPNDELEDFPSEEALKRAQELISTLGMTNLGKPSVYAVTLDSFEKFREHYPTDEFFNDKYPLTKENEIYYLTFSKVFDGIELADISRLQIKNSTDSGSDIISSPTVKIGISKDNIFYFESGANYEAEYETVSDEPVKYDINYALSDLQSFLEKNHYSTERSVKIDQAKIVYLPIEVKGNGIVEFVPVWSFEGYMGNKNDPFFWKDYKIMVRADDGTRIIIE